MLKAINQRRISAEFLEELQVAFGKPDTLRPGFDRDEALWQAAQKAVVDWIYAKVHVQHEPNK